MNQPDTDFHNEIFSQTEIMNNSFFFSPNKIISSENSNSTILKIKYKIDENFKPKTGIWAGFNTREEFINMHLR